MLFASLIIGILSVTDQQHEVHVPKTHRWWSSFFDLMRSAGLGRCLIVFTDLVLPFSLSKTFLQVPQVWCYSNKYHNFVHVSLTQSPSLAVARFEWWPTVNSVNSWVQRPTSEHAASHKQVKFLCHAFLLVKTVGHCRCPEQQQTLLFSAWTDCFVLYEQASSRTLWLKAFPCKPGGVHAAHVCFVAAGRAQQIKPSSITYGQAVLQSLVNPIALKDCVDNIVALTY
jgi:hypothetical protein